jgi:hypothetical protein
MWEIKRIPIKKKIKAGDENCFDYAEYSLAGKQEELLGCGQGQATTPQSS